LGQRAADAINDWLGVGQQALGAELISQGYRRVGGNIDHANEPGPTGFKPPLVASQQWDVYPHVRGNAGAVVSGTATAALIAGAQLADDYRQWRAGQVGAEAELRDDIVGAQVGQIMLRGLKTGANAQSMANQIAGLLCTK
jgi:hypothetical protein